MQLGDVLNPTNPSIMARYGAALASTALAVALRAGLTPALETNTPYATAFLAVLFAAWYGGYGPAMASLAMSALACAFLFVRPLDSLWTPGSQDQLGLILFLLAGGGIALLGGMMRGAGWQAERATAAEMEQREYLQTALNSIGDAVIVTDLAGRVTALNPVAEQLTGWTIDEARGKPLDQVFVIRNEATGQTVDNPVQRVLASGAIVGLANHTVLIDRSGSARPIDDSAAPIIDARRKTLGVILVFRDVSERRRAERAVAESGARNTAILEAALDCMVTMDHEGRIIEFNPAAERTFGYTRAQAIGRQVGELLVPPHLRERHYQGLRHYLATGEGPVLHKRIEIQGLRADGSLIDIELAVVPIASAGPPLFTAYLRDISRDKARERQRNARLSITQILARTVGVRDAVPAVIETICKSLHWEMGAVWTVDRQANVMRCEETWHEGTPELGEFADVTRKRTFAPGEGLPGRIWTSRAPAWIQDVTVDANFPRAPAAVKARIHGAFGFPLTAGEYVIGIIEFFSSEIREPDDDLLEMMAAVGTQIGQVIERRRSEATLHEIEQRSASVVDNVVDGILTIDEHGLIQTANPAAERLFGYTLEELVGQNVKLVMPEPYRSEHDEYIARYLDTGVAKIIGIGREVEGRRKDGSVFPLELAVSEFHQDTRRYFTGIVRDITSRKRAENSLRFLADASIGLASLTDETSALQKLARLSIPFFADWCVVHLAGEDRTISRVAMAHVDLDKEKRLEQFYQAYPVDWESAVPSARVMQAGQPLLVSVIDDDALRRVALDDRHLKLIQELTPRSCVIVPLIVRSKVLGVIGFVISESDRRYAADDLALAEELARRAAIAIDNARLYAELRVADRRKDEFLAMLAHELRNPLAPIRNALELIEAGMDEKTLRWAHDLIRRQVEHIIRLVDDLLDVSRIMRGKIQLKPEPVELAAVIQHAVEEARPAIDAENHELTLSLPDEPVWVRADPVRLSQVISNLLDNATKYTNPNGRISLRAEAADSTATITIRDSGIGIAPEMLSQLFTPFTQLTPAHDRSRGGLGIGLALVRSLVEMHHGTVEARSEGLGKGSEFAVQLPRIEPPMPDESDSVAQASRAARRVLVVDDNRVAADTLGLLLTKMGGHEVSIAYDGPSALSQIDGARPDIMFLDIGLPGMDGYEVARRVRELPDGQAILLVALTGYGQLEDRRKSQAAGFDAHYVKPMPIGELQAVFAHQKLASR